MGLSQIGTQTAYDTTTTSGGRTHKWPTLVHQQSVEDWRDPPLLLSVVLSVEQKDNSGCYGKHMVPRTEHET